MNEYAKRLPRGGALRGEDEGLPATPAVLALEQVASWDGPPLILFAGISTGGSLVHAVFGGWAAVLGRHFIAGWAGALTAIADVPFTGALLAQFTQAAAPHRPLSQPARGSEDHG
jgi:hypothetical protein